jgi:hypothetical protein
MAPLATEAVVHALLDWLRRKRFDMEDSAARALAAIAPRTAAPELAKGLPPLVSSEGEGNFLVRDVLDALFRSGIRVKGGVPVHIDDLARAERPS